jgi:hypothetical protein
MIPKWMILCWIVLAAFSAVGFYYLYRLAFLCLSAYDQKSIDIRYDQISTDTGVLRMERMRNDTIIQNSY